MKHLLILAFAFLVSKSVKAQDKMNSKIHSKMAKPKNCVMMEDGKMMQIKDGKTIMIKQDMKMANGHGNS